MNRGVRVVKNERKERNERIIQNRIYKIEYTK
jgi:hypothetical protein